MQKRKRCLSWVVTLLLAVVLSTIMLMPSVSRAAHTTTAADLRAEGIKEPVIGEKIPTETQLMVVDPNSFEPVKGKTYWMVEEADTWKPTNGGVFEGGKRYRLKVDVELLRLRLLSAFSKEPLKVRVNDIAVTPDQASDYHVNYTIEASFVMYSKPYTLQEIIPQPPVPQPPVPQPEEPKKAGWKELAGGRWEYRLENGERLTSAWKGDYYLKKDGIMADNEWIYDQKLKAWYYLKKGGRYARNEWQGAYYLKKHGNMARAEWIYDEHYKGWYYLTKEGSYARLTWQGNYYLGKYGKMVVSDWVYDKNYRAWYYLTAEGSYARNTVIDGKYRVGADGKYIR